MKLLSLVVAVIVASSASAFAAPLSYRFDFAPTSTSGPVTFSYQTESATAPGMVLSDVQSSLPPAFPLVAVREPTGEWSFTWQNSPTFAFHFTAQTNLDFPNSPGLYLTQPALVTSQIMFVTSTVPGTVDISIQAVPEPRAAFLMFIGLTAFWGSRVCPAILRRVASAPIEYSRIPFGKRTQPTRRECPPASIA
jgi:hypothetical protein